MVLCNDSEIEVEERCSLRDLRPGAEGVRPGNTGTGLMGMTIGHALLTWTRK